MRKRMNRVTVCLDDKEYDAFLSLQKKTKLSKSQLIRYMISSCTPIEAPPADYPKLIRELRAVGNNLNQLVRLARGTGYLNSSELNKILNELRKTEHEVNLAFTVKQGK